LPDTHFAVTNLQNDLFEHATTDRSKSMNTRLPNFLIIGAAKSGTTSLASYLGQHPDVFISPWKEPNYFALAGQSLPHIGPAPPEVIRELIHGHTVTDFAKYTELFCGAGNASAVGEASVRYLYYPQAASRIAETLKQPRIVAVLREPVSRCYSHYRMNVQFQLEPLEFQEALDAEEARKKSNWDWDWHYASVSRYTQQIQRYFDHFGREQVKVILYDDFMADPVRIFQEVCAFIGVASNLVPDMSRRGKVPYVPVHAGFDRWLHWPSRSRRLVESVIPRRLRRPLMNRLAACNRKPAAKLDVHLKRRLGQTFREEIQKLEQLLGRSTGWLEGSTDS
jgi:Sulfotransferase family